MGTQIACKDPISQQYWLFCSCHSSDVMDPLQLLPQELGAQLWWPALTFSCSGSAVSVLHHCTPFGSALRFKAQKPREWMGKWQEIQHCYHPLHFCQERLGRMIFVIPSNLVFYYSMILQELQGSGVLLFRPAWRFSFVPAFQEVLLPGDPWESRSWRGQQSFCDPELPSLPERTVFQSRISMPGPLLSVPPNFGWRTCCHALCVNSR